LRIAVFFFCPLQSRTLLPPNVRFLSITVAPRQWIEASFLTFQTAAAAQLLTSNSFTRA
jgi:hypothetical protein